MLAAHGYEVYNFRGGMRAWTGADLPVKRPGTRRTRATRAPVAAVGGVLIPAGLYLLFNVGSGGGAA